MALAFAHFGKLDNGEIVPLAYLVSNGAELVIRPVFFGISAVL